MAAIAIAQPHAEVNASSRQAWLPSYCDLLVAFLIVWLFGQGPGWTRLFMDGDTGWHIRTGEYILTTGSIPQHDLFSFSRPGAEWFAWEWLTDVLFAGLHSYFGLKGIAVLCGVAIVASAALLMRQMAARGANTFIALMLAVLSIGASSVHYHARPHVFTMLFLTIAVGIIHRHLERPTRAIWLLIPLAAIWTNMHGGFLVLVAFLGLTALGVAAERKWRESIRLLILTGACAAASILNPFGFGLHKHIADYLRSGFIANLIQEFQSPSFRSEGTLQFEVLLFIGIGCCVLAALRGRYATILPVLFLGHESLSAARHIPLYVIVCLPVIAMEITVLWRRWVEQADRKSTLRVLDGVAADAGQAFSRITVWSLVGIALAVSFTPDSLWPTDFDAKQFPRQMVTNHAEMLTKARLFTTDQWGDYLIYHLYPRVRVYIDGRSDFYGEQIGRDYLALLELQGRWREVLDKNQFDTILAPPSWPLVSALRMSPEWRKVDEDSQSVLFTRNTPR